jgi:gliding motility-associated-like protein
LSNNYALPSGVTTFYAKVYSLANTNCYAYASFTVTLNNAPVANAVNPVFICDDAGNDGMGIFNLQGNTATILGSQNAGNYTVTYHNSQSNADNDSNPLALNYQNTSNPQTIYARVENNLNPTCFATTSFAIGLHKMPIAHQSQNLFACDDASNDGFESFNLASQNAVVLGTQSASDFTVSYHLLQTEANSGINPLPNNYINAVNPQTIYARVVNNLNASCFDTKSFQLVVKNKPVINMNDTYTICQGASIMLSAPSGFSSYLWSNGTITPTVLISQAGNYSVTVTKNYGNIVCDATKNIVVYSSGIAVITNIEARDWTSDENTITINVTGDGDYEYSIDGIHYQDSPVFSGLNCGQYTVYVQDKKGCGIAKDDVFLLMYPKFFTPNGDGFNDTWRIKFSNTEPKMRLIIYDRYGKLITTYSGSNFGWDGKLNGVLLPSDDYWFVVQRENGREYKGHFSMKR